MLDIAKVVFCEEPYGSLHILDVALKRRGYHLFTPPCKLVKVQQADGVDRFFCITLCKISYP